ncbi:MAG: hypothetical protein PHV33_05045 [Elusimicrobiales bacterium]|nr:hypothetical protein [Elusimicrobiales bacterium]
MEDDVTPERRVELGDLHLGRGELDLAVRCYNLALKKNLAHPAANRRLAQAYRLKAEREGAVFYLLAVEPLRRALAADPLDESLHELLQLLALKTGSIASLTREYSKKAKSGPDKDFNAAQLKRAAAMSVVGSEVLKQGFEYKPIPYVKSFFDFIVLPGAAVTIAVGNLSLKFKPFLLLGATLFLFYCAYRGILYLLLRRQ